MTLELWLTYVAACTVLLVIPGPTTLAVISYSLAQGSRAKLPLVIAVALGDSTALVVSLMGLGAVLAASALAFTALKWVGGLYLIYLGVRMGLAGWTASAATFADVPPVSRWRLFVNTYLVTALNPKGIIFFVAFLPQFIDPTGDVNQQLWLLAMTFVTLSIIDATLYAHFAGAARRVLSTPRAQRRFLLTGGGLMCVAGVWALLSKQKA
jgi:threonine/homoserine/homoserine lactone efflux protein